MTGFLEILVAIALAAVLLIVGYGVYNMSREGAQARTRSNKLMRLRVLVQFFAIIILMLLFYLGGSRP